MRTIWTIAKREFGAYFKSPVGYVVLSVFLGLTSFFFFFWFNFFMRGSASLEALFIVQPWVLVLFAPAIAMRLLAEEKASGTIEMLLTMPVSDVAVVIGKFLAALGVLAIGLALTFPLVLTVAKLGPLDWGPVIAGYLGTLLLGGTYLAIGLFISAMTKSQVVAFIIAAVVCLLLAILGTDYAATVVGTVVQYMSPEYQFQKITRGVIELRNVIYYLSAVGLLLLGSTQALESRRWTR